METGAGYQCRCLIEMLTAGGRKSMGWLFFWIVLLGLPLLLGFGFAFEKILKRIGRASSHEDGA
ncbi:hypothetical protein [Brucella pituitosa]|uniref:Uncharacterized protein n=1 Tax=Brucella pituitosa TaxID=571256 RepID=A0A643ETB0_9HYPH|nr:hypothetical protein [Brucella pituitosa]KAB0565315.1 hypothetical protein F7Q93_23355 [Brucella pituitosa]